MRSSKLLFFASWIILLIVAGVIVLLSMNSLFRAYTNAPDNLTSGYTLDKIRETGDQIREHGGEDAVKAFKGRRATAATWALGYWLLAIFVVAVPYRRGERWAWWALLLSLGLSQGLSLLRAPMLETTHGAGAPAVLLALTLLALLAAVPRFFRRETVATVD